MKKTISISGVEAKPGTKAHGVLKIPNGLADGSDVEIPFTIFNGADGGPWLHIQVAQHGVEVHALEAIRRVTSEISLKKLKGVLIYCLPNPIAFRQRQTVMSYDFISGGMNRIWPGKPEGSLTERMAYSVWTNLIEGKAEYLIDFHTGRRSSPVWAMYEAHGVSPGVAKEVADKSERMAKVFGAELIQVETEAYEGGKTCRSIAVDHGIPGIVPEIGGESHFNPEYVEITYRGLKNIMIDLGMIQGKVKLPKKQVVIKWAADNNKISARAPKGGVHLTKVKIGDRVKRGDVVGVIYSPRTFEEIAKVTSPQDGLVFSIDENPIVVAGQSVMRIPEVIKEIVND